MKLQRQRRGEKLRRRRAARGPGLTGKAPGRGSGVEVIPLNKHGEDGSHNNREVRAGATHEEWRDAAFDPVDTGVVARSHAVVN